MNDTTTNNGPTIRVDCRACGSTHDVAPYASGFYSSDCDFCLNPDCGSGDVLKTMLLVPAQAAPAKSNRKPFNDRAGYIASMRAGPVDAADGKRGWVVIYLADDQGLDSAGGRYVTVCETHCTIVNSTNLPNARGAMKDPTEFCDCCRGTCLEYAIAPFTCPSCGKGV